MKANYWTGRHLGNYLLTRQLGSGGFGDVYLGEHLRDHTLAAVKVLKAQLSTHEIKQFVNEARTIRLKHPHIVELLDFGIGKDDTPFLVMDYAPHGTLRQRHTRGEQLPLPTILTYVRPMAAALQYAHDQLVIHRDVKPENMLFGRHGVLLLSDFGLALIARSSDVQSQQLMAGTIHYMAPEQILGQPCPASDQYALGTVVYEWLCGDRPFHGSFQEIITHHLHASPPPLRERMSAISPDVEQVGLKTLVKEPKERFARVEDFALALERATQAQEDISPIYNDPNPPSQQPPYGQLQQPLYGQPPYGPPQQPYGQPQYGVIPELVYVPQPPPKKRRTGLWIFLGILAVLMLASIGGVAALVYAGMHNPTTDVVNKYYSAIENQDYATAYSYLDPSTITYNNQNLTETLYSQAAQAIDTQKGKVTSYSITSTNVNSSNGVNTATFTVSVTRNGSPYDVHLKLQQEGSNWKIVAIDNV